MPALDIILDGDSAWPELATREEDIIHLPSAVLSVAVLPGGMASGRPSVAIRVDLPDGRVLIAETSWALLGAAARAIAARYGWPE